MPSTFHAIVWMDQQQAQVVMFDKEHSESVKVRSHSHASHQGKSHDEPGFYADIAARLAGTHEVLLTGPGQAHDKFRVWCAVHQPAVAKVIVGSSLSDHPSEGQLVALARKYFSGFDRMALDPALLNRGPAHDQLAPSTS